MSRIAPLSRRCGARDQSSALGITSTMALPMPTTSSRGAVIEKVLGPGKTPEGAEYKGETGESKAGFRPRIAAPHPWRFPSDLRCVLCDANLFRGVVGMEIRQAFTFDDVLLVP